MCISFYFFTFSPFYLFTFLITRQFGIITLCNKPAFINDVNIE